MTDLIRRMLALAATLVVAPLALATEAPSGPIRLQVDLSEAPLRIVHAELSIPVQPGPLTLLYPKWIPGEHSPSGPIADLTALVMRAGGKTLAWERDPVDMFTFHVEVPPEASSLEVKLDYLTPSETGRFTASPASTDQMAVLSWNTVLLYPAGPPSDDLIYRASLKLPPGWEFGTALPLASPTQGHTPEPSGLVEFQPASLTTLVDSPVLAGAHFRAVDITGGAPVLHEIDMAADSDAALAIPQSEVDLYTRLVAEAQALFGAHHYRNYHFLLTLSDHTNSFGLEHHESSDNRVKERTLIDPDTFVMRAGLLPHEFVHSWNGKYRRPAGLATPDYEKPMVGDLLWVYEGLTSYLGDVLTARSGLWTPERYREELALIAAGLTQQARPGRTWRPLADTARAAQLLFGQRSEGSSMRRGVDFYDEGVLIWLEADTVIREQTGGQRSLDDFLKLFHGAPSGPPAIKPYTFDDLVAALEKTAPYDWRRFFDERVTAVHADAPLGGITHGGWRLAFSDQINEHLKAREKADENVDLRFSLGLTLSTKKGDDNGRVLDAIAGSPAALAGVAPGMKLVTVGGRAWSADILREAIRAAQGSTQPIVLTLDNADYVKTVRVDYHGGERYPHLVRDARQPDLLSQIIAPHAE